MYFKKSVTFAILSIVIASALSLTSCNSEDAPDSVDVSISDKTIATGDTIYVTPQISTFQKSQLSNVSETALNFISTLDNPISRTDNETDVYYLEDCDANKYAYAISHPTIPNAYIYECYGSDDEAPLIMIFKETSANNFVIIDEDGVELRYFSYNPDLHEL